MASTGEAPAYAAEPLAGTSQTLMVLSSLPVAMEEPSGLKQRPSIFDVWPARVASGFPVAASQILAVLSKLPVATRAPSGLKRTWHTSASWPWSFRSGSTRTGCAGLASVFASSPRPSPRKPATRSAGRMRCACRGRAEGVMGVLRGSCSATAKQYGFYPRGAHRGCAPARSGEFLGLPFGQAITLRRRRHGGHTRRHGSMTKKKTGRKKTAAGASSKASSRKTTKHVDLLLHMERGERSAYLESLSREDLVKVFEESHAADLVNILLDLKKAVVKRLFEIVAADRKRGVLEVAVLYHYKEYLTNPLPLRVETDTG